MVFVDEIAEAIFAVAFKSYATDGQACHMGCSRLTIAQEAICWHAAAAIAHSLCTKFTTLARFVTAHT